MDWMDWMDFVRYCWLGQDYKIHLCKTTGWIFHLGWILGWIIPSLWLGQGFLLHHLLM